MINVGICHNAIIGRTRKKQNGLTQFPLFRQCFASPGATSSEPWSLTRHVSKSLSQLIKRVPSPSYSLHYSIDALKKMSLRLLSIRRKLSGSDGNNSDFRWASANRQNISEESGRENLAQIEIEPRVTRRWICVQRHYRSVNAHFSWWLDK